MRELECHCNIPLSYIFKIFKEADPFEDALRLDWDAKTPEESPAFPPEPCGRDAEEPPEEAPPVRLAPSEPDEDELSWP